MYITIKSLWERHKNKSMIARLTSHDWKTVTKKIKEIEEGKEYLAKKPHPRILDPYQEQIMKWLEEDLSEVRIHEKLREEGVKAEYSTGKEYIAQIKKREKVFVRMHALPGEERQVNFGYLRLLYYAMKARKEKSGSLNNITTYIFEDKTISNPIFTFIFILATILAYIFCSIHRTRVKTIIQSSKPLKISQSADHPVCQSILVIQLPILPVNGVICDV